MKWVWRILGILAAVLVIAFFAFRVPDTDPAEMRAKYAGEPSQFVELADGREVHVRDEGPRDAPVIMLLHGSNADLHTWQEWAELLRDDYRIVRYDQRGHGLTGPASDDDYSLEGFTADVDAVADALGIRTFTLAGNSMGGWIAAGYAIENPGRLDALVLVDAAGAPIRREGGGNIAFTLAGWPVVGDIMSQLLPRSLVEKSLSQSVSNQDIVTDEAVDRYWEMARYPGNRSATRKRFSTPRSSFDEEEISGIRVPTMVMWGKEDALIPFEAAGWYMDHLPDATLVAYDGIGHIPMEEAPERSATDLMVWLSEMRMAPMEQSMELPTAEAVLTP
ncbi:alpha/beta hydrolase [Qipengyuania sp. 1XM1-15A]|uniref:alpha/beta fold hydrolase n=1 Tax=Qipengyuania xiamenensis TaxID=2867237 RepID=UPI001C870860|nr:alpha/beta hydrolase [Qipengyuania xiamenensis]MBX7532227.1 alpha/beta hydrolase [Qipengyuania xiamenensis]